MGLLHIPTLGISSAVWLWVASREMDAYSGSGRSHAFAMAAVLVALPALVLGFVGSNAEHLDLPWDDRVVAPLGPVGVLGMFSAGALALAALCMIWWPLERAQRDLGVPADSSIGLLLMVVLPSIIMSILAPFLFIFSIAFIFITLSTSNANYFIGLLIGLFLVSLVPSVFVSIALGKTQAGLNRLWAGAVRPAP